MANDENKKRPTAFGAVGLKYIFTKGGCFHYRMLSLKPDVNYISSLLQIIGWKIQWEVHLAHNQSYCRQPLNRHV